MSKEMYAVYERMALELPHVCSGCGTNQRLSRSHLVPKGQDSKLKAVFENLRFHCFGDSDSCHSRWESVAFWKLNDAYSSMEYIYSVRPDYFWLKLNHAIDVYEKHLNGLKLIQLTIGDKAITDCETALEKLNAMKQIAEIKFTPVTPESYDGSKFDKYKFDEI